MPTVRAAARGDPRTIYAKTSAYHNSFLPRTVHEPKANLKKVSVNQYMQLIATKHSIIIIIV